MKKYEDALLLQATLTEIMKQNTQTNMYMAYIVKNLGDICGAISAPYKYSKKENT